MHQVYAECNTQPPQPTHGGCTVVSKQMHVCQLVQLLHTTAMIRTTLALNCMPDSITLTQQLTLSFSGAVGQISLIVALYRVGLVTPTLDSMFVYVCSVISVIRCTNTLGAVIACMHAVASAICMPVKLATG